MWPFGDKSDAAAEADVSELASSPEEPPSAAAAELQLQVSAWYKAGRLRVEQDTRQRKTLFWFAVFLGSASVIASILGFALIGLGTLNVEPAVAIAFFSASAVQGFAMLGLIVRGLFLGDAKSNTAGGPPSREGEAK